MNNELIRVLLALKAVKGIGNVKARKIIDQEEINNENADRFLSFAVIESASELTRKVESGALNETAWKLAVDRADNIIEACARAQIQVISYMDDAYPENLLTLKNFPLILYVKGNPEILNRPKSIAIVGTREPTPTGAKMAQAFGRQFGKDGYVIVSGLAIGCDSYGHEGALESGAPTVALLASGLDQPVYPAQNKELAEKIIATGGALVSEYEPGVQLRPQYLVARDAWQSGMSDGVVAVETGIKGGTLHAMKHALANERPLGMLSPDGYRELVQNSQVPEGNLKYISGGQADGLFQLASVRAFEDKMMTAREARLASMKAATSKRASPLAGEQGKLF